MKDIKNVGNLKASRGFEIDLNGHTLITDARVDNGGNNLGPIPKQLL